MMLIERIYGQKQYQALSRDLINSKKSVDDMFKEYFYTGDKEDLDIKLREFQNRESSSTFCKRIK